MLAEFDLDLICTALNSVASKFVSHNDGIELPMPELRAHTTIVVKSYEVTLWRVNALNR